MSEFDVLYETILSRKENAEEGSYTRYLFDKGLEKILKKVGEESCEVVIAAMKHDNEECKNEICDVIYHLFVMMAELGITLDDVNEELKKRSLKLNNFKGERKKIENI